MSKKNDDIFIGYEEWQEALFDIFNYLEERFKIIIDPQQASGTPNDEILQNNQLNLLDKSVNLQYMRNAIYENNSNFEILIRYHEDKYKDVPLDTRAASMLDDLLLFLDSKEGEFMGVAKTFDGD